MAYNIYYSFKGMEAAALARFRRRMQRAERRYIQGNNQIVLTSEYWSMLQSSPNKSIKKVVQFLSKTRVDFPNTPPLTTEPYSLVNSFYSMESKKEKANAVVKIKAKIAHC